MDWPYPLGSSTGRFQMAKKTHFALLMVALSFVLGACSSTTIATAPAKDKNYESIHERAYPLAARVDRY